jgi:exopolyphosphatase/guanosine-5'-triphosphate,3'-diphosphate pyrophosphatase
MGTDLNNSGGENLGFMDIGTNSIRLLLVRINMNGSHTIIREEKEVVRLGEHEYGTGLLHPVAMKRAVIVCKRFVEVARSYNVSEIHTVATSAMRDARNRNDLLKVLEKEIAPDVSVISGREEARLIYLGVSTGVQIGSKKAIFIDIGGGSTEIILGDQYEYSFLDSLKLGALRVSTLYPGDQDGKVNKKTYDEMKEYARSKLVKTGRVLAKEKWKFVFGSSGTIQNLAEISSKMYKSSERMGGITLSLTNLKKVSKFLRKLNLEERRLVAGMNSSRADIIIGGAAVLESVMEEIGIRSIVTSKRGLKHGLMIEVLQRKNLFPKAKVPVRDRSVLHLARECNFEEDHSKKVRDLSLQLFDSSKDIGLHDLDESDRELMGHAAILHDIGNLISFRKHHHHSYYIIMNSELLGFNMKEITILANITRYHRKRAASEKDLKIEGLDQRSRYKVKVMATLLRLAENLDRAHRGQISKVGFTSLKNGTANLRVEAGNDCHLERWGLNASKEAFVDMMGYELDIDFRTCS